MGVDVEELVDDEEEGECSTNRIKKIRVR